MQVQKIQGTAYGANSNTNKKSGITFGYNQALNDEFIKNLERHRKNKAFYSFLGKLINSTNEAELKLKEAEKKNNVTLQSNLIATFLPIKIILSNIVNALFPDFDYRKKEIEAYNEEIKQNEEIQNNPDHWMNTLVEALTENQKQEETEAMANQLSIMMKELFPSVDFDFSGLHSTIREHYVDNKIAVREVEAEGDEDVADTEFDSDIKQVKDLQESIKLGKTKVEEYIPSSMAEKGFDGLGGMKELKETLNDKVVGVLKDPAQAKLDHIEYGKKIPKGLLLYGPPGTGKTTVLEHLSSEAGVPLLKLKVGLLKTSWAHESSRNIEAAFDYAESIATPEKPVLLMIDDADAMFMKRGDNSQQFETEELNTFLGRISTAADNNVMVVATTNKYDIMDDAIKSRFDEQIYVGLPDQEARISILKMLLNQRTKGQSLAANDQEIEKVAKKLEKFAIREIIGISNRAAMLALKDGRRDITAADYEKIISESQNLKVKEELYKTNATRKPIGY